MGDVELHSFVVDNSESDLSRFFMDSEYDTEKVVRNNYMQTLDHAQQYAEEALEELR